MTAVARSNYNLYTQSGVTLNTEKFGTIESWRPYRGEAQSVEPSRVSLIFL